MSRVIAGAYAPNLSMSQLFKESEGKPLQLSYAELARSFPRDTVILFGTHNDLKTSETARPLRYHDIRVVQSSSVLAGTDSKEEQATPIEIAKDKVREAIEIPYWDLTPAERFETLKAIGAASEQHVLLMGEDRELKTDNRLRYAKIWKDLGVTDLPLVKECFQSGELWPGKRINELSNAVGGEVNFLRYLEIARQELQEKIDNKETRYNRPQERSHTSYATYYLKPLVPGLLPIPDDGIYVCAAEHGRRFLQVTEEHIRLEEAGHHLDLNYFDVPANYWGMRDDYNQPVTIELLRTLPDNDYFDTEYYAARAMRGLASALEIPKLLKSRDNRKVDRPQAKLISNLNFGEFACPFESGEEISGYKRLTNAFRIQSGADLERPFFMAEGVVIEPFPAQAPEGVDQDLYRLIRRLEANLIVANRVVLKPLFEASAAGRPIMINQAMREQEMAWYFDAAKFKTVTGRPDMVIESWSDLDSLRSRMEQGQWEADKFKTNPRRLPEFDLMDEAELQDLLGNHERRFRVSLCGSASSHIPSGNEDARYIAEKLAEIGVDIFHGGGSRYIMRRFPEGSKAALDNGADVLDFGVRVPVASRKEGSVRPLIESFGLSIDGGGDVNQNHFTYGDGHFHVLTTKHMAEREHVMFGAADAAVEFLGGTGTYEEIFKKLYHNAMIEHRGYGIFPGFDNERKKPVFVMNSEVENGVGKRGYYDRLKEMFSEEERAIIDVQFFDNRDALIEAVFAYGRIKGYEPTLLPPPNVDEPEFRT